MKAAIFPGQGSQVCGMGKDLYDSSTEARRIFDEANAILGFKLTDIMFGTDEAQLRQTNITQTAIFLHSYVLTQLLGDDLNADVTAGHSLGEYSAAVFAGAISFEDGLRLVQKRGQLMHEAGKNSTGTMAAIVGLDIRTVSEIVNDAGAVGIVQAANYNSPGQIVVSGEAAAVRAAIGIAKTRKARLAKELTVSGAFHSALMKPAEEELKAELDKINIQDARILVYMNASATPEKKANVIRKLLVRQLTSPVLWEQTVHEMVRYDITRFVEVGPGKVLQGLVKRTFPNAVVSGIEKFADLKQYVEAA